MGYYIELVFDKHTCIQVYHNHFLGQTYLQLDHQEQYNQCTIESPTNATLLLCVLTYDNSSFLTSP